MKTTPLRQSLTLRRVMLIKTNLQHTALPASTVCHFSFRPYPVTSDNGRADPPNTPNPSSSLRSHTRQQHCRRNRPRLPKHKNNPISVTCWQRGRHDWISRRCVKQLGQVRCVSLLIDLLSSEARYNTPADLSHRLDVWVTSSGLLGPPSISETSPNDLYKCFEANSMAPFFALKYAPPAMTKTTPKGNYANAAPKEMAYGSIVVVSSVASTYGGE